MEPLAAKCEAASGIEYITDMTMAQILLSKLYREDWAPRIKAILESITAPDSAMKPTSVMGFFVDEGLVAHTMFFHPPEPKNCDWCATKKRKLVAHNIERHGRHVTGWCICYDCCGKLDVVVEAYNFMREQSIDVNPITGFRPCGPLLDKEAVKDQTSAGYMNTILAQAEGT